MTSPSVTTYTVYRSQTSLARFRHLSDAIAWALANNCTQVRHKRYAIWWNPAPQRRDLTSHAHSSIIRG